MDCPRQPIQMEWMYEVDMEPNSIHNMILKELREEQMEAMREHQERLDMERKQRMEMEEQCRCRMEEERQLEEKRQMEEKRRMERKRQLEEQHRMEKDSQMATQTLVHPISEQLTMYGQGSTDRHFFLGHDPKMVIPEETGPHMLRLAACVQKAFQFLDPLPIKVTGIRQKYWKKFEIDFGLPLNITPEIESGLAIISQRIRTILEVNYQTKPKNVFFITEMAKKQGGPKGRQAINIDGAKGVRFRKARVHW